MYTVTYTNKFTGMIEIAGYSETLAKAKKLSKCFLKGGRLTTETQIYHGEAGGERVE
jgi:hypothetical protein